MSYINKGSMPVTVTVSREPDRSGNFVCDGTADDVEIQAAINYIEGLGFGGTIYIKHGCYYITTTIIIPRVGATDHGIPIVLIGEGYPEDHFWHLPNFGTVLMADGLDGDMIDTTDYFNFFAAEKITFVGNDVGMGGSQISGHLIHIRNPQEVWIRDCEVRYAYDDGIFLEKTSTYTGDVCVIDHTRVEDCGDYGIRISSGVVYGFICNCQIEINLIGIYLGGIQWGVINNSVEDNTQRGIMVSSSENRIIGNRVTVNGREGIFVDGDDNVITDNIVNGNGDIGPDRHGIRIYGADDCIIANNLIFDDASPTQTPGIKIENGSAQCVVTGNLIYNQNGNGIEINGSPNCSVTSNFSHNNAGWGIIVDNDADYNKISNNYTLGNSSGSIRINNANCDNNQIEFNTVEEGAPGDVGTQTRSYGNYDPSANAFVGDVGVAPF